MDTDVLIVGAGPTGLMLANQLARHGLRPQLIDRHAGPARETRALGVQARTLEIYSHLGIVERTLALGKRATGAGMWSRGRLAARIPLGDIGYGMSAYPFLLILGQDDNEKLLGDALRGHGMDVAWNTELVALSQEPDRVQAKLKQPDGSIREVAASWVAGCDGAHSAVRELNSIPFEGAPYEHVFFLADTRAKGPMLPEILNIYLWRRGFHLFFPMRGDDHWRVIGILPAPLRGRQDLTLDDVIPSIRRETGPGLQFHECSWFSTYRIHHRRAARFRKGRCFLLGDAAHIHSPVGAQGMNTGLQDAYNLAWKLALVASGKADPALLDSYEAERLPVASHLLETTDRGFSFIVSESRLAGWFRLLVLPKALALALHVESFRRRIFRTISQIGIRYHHSNLSQSLSPEPPEGAPRAGDRFPWLRLRFPGDAAPEDFLRKLDDTRFALVLFGQEVPSGLSGSGDLLRTHVVPGDPGNDAERERARIPGTAFYLLRPDGYIGLCGERLDAAAVARYVSERVHLTPSGARPAGSLR